MHKTAHKKKPSNLKLNKKYYFKLFYFVNDQSYLENIRNK